MKRSFKPVLNPLAALLFATVTMISPAMATESFKKGDQIVVAQQDAPLMRGWNTLATLSRGQRLSVLETRGGWVGTSASVDGKTVTGWVWNNQVATPSQYAQRRTTRRSYSYQPGSMSGSVSSSGRRYSGSSGSSSHRQFIMGATPYGPSYWRADRKIKGY